MSKFNIKEYYSTKRKRDVVTGAAIALFGILIVFQLYITILFPLQLRHQKLLIAEMEKDEMYEQIDRIRDLIHSTRGKDYAQTGEIRLVEGVMDQFALHVREHGREMTPEQVGNLRNVLSRYELIVMTWREKKTDNFHIRQNELDAAPYAKTVESGILNSH
ncbi:MAG: hypothetical protein IKO02_01175 [Lentisphaeria bacterium]|nr:hypothetical protein [Lentisphaeria bacterium]